MFRNTQALKYILVSKNTGLRLIGQDIVQLWKMTVWQLSLHPGRTVSLHLQSLNCRNLNLGMITESYWNSQPSSLEVSLHGEYVSGIQVRYIVLAGCHLFYKDGAVSKPVQFSEAAGSVQKRIISLLWVNSLESPKVSQCICYSYLATTDFDCHMWYLSEHLIASAFFDEKVSHEKGWWLLHFGRMLGPNFPKILLNVYIPPRSLTVCITSCLYFITPVFKNLKAGLALFLEHDPSEWDNLEQYKRNQDTCHSV